MRRVHVLLLSAFVLGSVLLPVFDSTVGPGRFQPQRVQAQGQTAAAISVPCLASTLGFALCSGLVVLALATWKYSGGDLPTGQDLIDLVDGIVTYFDGNPAGVQQYVQQYANHPNYIWLTPDILTDIGNAIAGLASWGFEYGANWGGTNHPFYGRTWSSSRLVLKTDYLTLPSGANCSMVKNVGTAHQMLGGGGDVKLLTLEFEEFEAATYPATDWGFGGGSYSATALYSLWSGSSNGCELSGMYGRFVLTLPRTSESTNGMSGFEYALGAPLMVADWWVDGDNPRVTVNMTDFAIEGGEVIELEGERYNTPLSPDFLDTWDGVSEVPLYSGVTGAVIDATAVPVPDDTSWWEGLFGGLGGKLTGIGDVLGQIWDAIQGLTDTVADIWSAVVALPDTMVTAISAAVVPSESVSERTGDLGDTMAAKAPFAWPVVVFAVVSDLFEGGTDCPTIDMGTESVGWPAVEMEMCVPSGAQTILYTLTDVIAAAMVMVWAYWVYRRMLGS